MRSCLPARFFVVLQPNLSQRSDLLQRWGCLLCAAEGRDELSFMRCSSSFIYCSTAATSSRPGYDVRERVGPDRPTRLANWAQRHQAPQGGNRGGGGDPQSPMSICGHVILLFDAWRLRRGSAAGTGDHKGPQGATRGRANAAQWAARQCSAQFGRRARRPIVAAREARTRSPQSKAEQRERVHGTSACRVCRAVRWTVDGRRSTVDGGRDGWVNVGSSVETRGATSTQNWAAAAQGPGPARRGGKASGPDRGVPESGAFCSRGHGSVSAARRLLRWCWCWRRGHWAATSADEISAGNFGPRLGGEVRLCRQTGTGGAQEPALCLGDSIASVVL